MIIIIILLIVITSTASVAIKHPIVCGRLNGIYFSGTCVFVRKPCFDTPNLPTNIIPTKIA